MRHDQTPSPDNTNDDVLLTAPTRQELLEALATMVSIFDTPLARRRFDGDYANEARRMSRDVLDRERDADVHP